MSSKAPAKARIGKVDGPETSKVVQSTATAAVIPPKKQASGKNKPAVAEPTKSQSKAQRKAQKAALEARRKAEVSQMMHVYESSDEEDAPVRKPAKAVQYDSFGNEIRATQAPTASTAKARIAADATPEPPPARPASQRQAPIAAVDYEQQDAEAAAAAQAKAATGGRLSNKEKKLLKRLEEAAVRTAAESIRVDNGLSAFSVTLAGGAAAAARDDHAVDIRVDGFSISAPKGELLRDANLKLAHGRRYGLLGSNGKGKTTLLRFLEARALPMPAGIDCLLVQQEVPPSDTPVYEQVCCNALCSCSMRLTFYMIAACALCAWLLFIRVSLCTPCAMRCH
jgi:ABC-type glutathione transport system ATPase component